MERVGKPMRVRFSIAILAAATVLGPGALAADYYVNDASFGEVGAWCTAAGNDAVGTGAVGAPYASVQGVFDNRDLAAGDRIRVDIGAHSWGATQDSGADDIGASGNPILIEGNTAGVVRIDFTGSQQMGFLIDQDYFKIDQLEFKYGGDAVASQVPAIRLIGSDRSTVSNCTFENVWTAVELDRAGADGADDCIVELNSVVDCLVNASARDAISVGATGACLRAIVRNNTIVQSNHGVVVGNASNDVLIKGNDISDTSGPATTAKGILIQGGSDDAIIRGNQIRGNVDATSDYWQGIHVNSGSDGALIQSNILHNIQFTGIHLAGDGSISEYNTVYDCEHGFRIDPTVPIASAIVRNNIVWSFDQGGTNGYCIYYLSGNVSPTSDYNNLYATSCADVAFDGATTYATLADWQASGLAPDANSISADPKFVDRNNAVLLNRDFHLLSRYGYYTKLGGPFTTTTTISPSVDGANPAASYASEVVSGGRADQGAYGNTSQAAWSHGPFWVRNLEADQVEIDRTAVADQIFAGDQRVWMMGLKVSIFRDPVLNGITVQFAGTMADADFALVKFYMSLDATFDLADDQFLAQDSSVVGGVASIPNGFEKIDDALDRFDRWFFVVVDFNASAVGKTVRIDWPDPVQNQFTVTLPYGAKSSEAAIWADNPDSPAVFTVQPAAGIPILGLESGSTSLPTGTYASGLHHVMSLEVLTHGLPDFTSLTIDRSAGATVLGEDISLLEVWRSSDSVLDAQDTLLGSIDPPIGAPPAGGWQVTGAFADPAAGERFYLLVRVTVAGGATAGRTLGLLIDAAADFGLATGTLDDPAPAVLPLDTGLVTIAATVQVASTDPNPGGDDVDGAGNLGADGIPDFQTFATGVAAIPAVPTTPVAVLIVRDTAVYAEAIVVSGKTFTAANTLLIRGVPGLWPVIDPPGAIGIDIDDIYVTVEHLITTGAGGTAGIRVTNGGDNATIRNVVSHNHTGPELLVQSGGNDVTVENCTMWDDEAVDVVTVQGGGTTGFRLKNSILAGSNDVLQIQTYTNVAASNYNCFFASDAKPIQNMLLALQISLNDWQLNTGFDADSFHVDPVFVTSGSDFHERSTTGSFPGNWDPEAVDGPCIDRGDPTSIFALEPHDNGLRVNMGAYGNTEQASRGKSHCTNHWTAQAGSNNWDDQLNWCHSKPSAALGGVRDYRGNVVIEPTSSDPFFNPAAASEACVTLVIRPTALFKFNTDWKTLDVEDDVTVVGTLDFTGSGFLNVGGDFYCASGTFAPTKGTVVFDGTSTQTIYTSLGQAFFNLTSSGTFVQTPSTTANEHLRVTGAFGVTSGTFRLGGGDRMTLQRTTAGWPPDKHVVAGTLELASGIGGQQTRFQMGDHQQLIVDGALIVVDGGSGFSFATGAYVEFDRFGGAGGYSIHVRGAASNLSIAFVKFRHLYGSSDGTSEETEVGSPMSTEVQSAFTVSCGVAGITAFRQCWFTELVDGDGAGQVRRYARYVYLLGDINNDGTTDRVFAYPGGLAKFHRIRFDSDVGVSGGTYNVEKDSPAATEDVLFKNCAGDIAVDAWDLDGDAGLPAPGDTGAEDILFGSSPTAVSLADLSARAFDGSVLVEWRTSQELDNLGFNVYRSRWPDHGWVQVNEGMILGLGDSLTGGRYYLHDRSVRNGTRYYYLLEDVDVRGDRTVHGPVDALPADGLGAPEIDPADYVQGVSIGPSFREEGPAWPGIPLAGLPPAPDRAGAADSLLGLTLREAGIRLLAWDESGALIEVLPPEPRLTDEVWDGELGTRVEMAGWSSTRVVGQPELPAKTLLLVTPGIERAAYRILESDSRAIGSIDPVRTRSPGFPSRDPAAPSGPSGASEAPPALAPPVEIGEMIREARRELLERVRRGREDLLEARRRARNGDPGGRSREPRPDGPSAAGTGAAAPAPSAAPPAPGTSFPGTLVDLGPLLANRGRQLLPIEIHPVQSSRGRLEVFRRILVRIDFFGRTPAPPSAPPDGPLDGPVQLALAADPSALKVVVREDGAYRLTRADLAAAGLDLSVDPRTIRMFHLGREIPILVLGELDGVLDDADAVVFWGEKNPWRTVDNPEATRHTDENVYWLTMGGPEFGRRMAALDAAASLPAPIFGECERVRHVEENATFFPRLAGGEGRDHWFGSTGLYNVAGGALATRRTLTTIALPHLSPAVHDAHLEVAFAGVTEAPPSPDHHVVVSVNGRAVGEVRWDGRFAARASFDVPSAFLVAGDNAVELLVPADVPGVPYDVAYANYLRLTCRERLVAEGGRLEWLAPDGGGTWEATGFADARSVLGLETGDPDAPRVLAGMSAGAGTVRLGDAGGARPRRFRLVELAALRAPVRLERNAPSNLHDGRTGATWLAIAPAFLLPGVARLADHRAAEGHATLAVDLTDVYDEFTAGIPDPAAIRGLLARGLASWSPRLRFAVLVGDGSLDPHGYRYSAGQIPVPMIQTVDLWTGSDAWYAAVEGGDELPDVAIGRLAVSTPVELESVVDKLLTRVGPDAGGWRSSVTLVADDDDATYDFTRATGDVAPRAGRPVETLFLGELGILETRARLRAAFDAGRGFVGYFGHGSTTNLARESVLDVRSAAALANEGRYPFVATFGCMAGIFYVPAQEGLGEALVETPRRGAIAVLGSTSLVAPGPQEDLYAELLSAIYAEDRFATLGEALAEAELRSATGGWGDTDQLRTWVLLGDPATPAR